MGTSFEVSGEPNVLSGRITQANVHEVTDPVAPTNIIRIDQDWFIHLKWELSGSLVAMIDGEWEIRVYLESAGAGFEGELRSPGDRVPVNPGAPKYEHKFQVSANTVPVGSYRLVTHINYNRPDGKPGPIAGFYDVPNMRFYDPGPPGP